MMANVMIMVIAIVAMIGMIKIENDIGEQHVLMMVIAADHVLNAGHSAGHGRLHENQH
jgi:hypothetical protein